MTFRQVHPPARCSRARYTDLCWNLPPTLRLRPVCVWKSSFFKEGMKTGSAGLGDLTLRVGVFFFKGAATIEINDTGSLGSRVCVLPGLENPVQSGAFFLKLPSFHD